MQLPGQDDSAMNKQLLQCHHPVIPMSGSREVDALPTPRDGLTTLHKRGRGRAMGSEAALQTTAPLILVTMQAT